MRRNIDTLEQAQALADAERAQEDPAIQRALQDLDTGLVDLIAAAPAVGGDSWKSFERECCRSLRTVRELRRTLSAPAQRDRIAKANLSWLEKRTLSENLDKNASKEIH